MKAHLDPTWAHWSDGRPFSKVDARKFRFVLARQKVKGESIRQRFERVLAIVEDYEAKKKSVLVTEPGAVRRAWNWLTGRPNAVKLELKPGR
jgi:hypothetical protein